MTRRKQGLALLGLTAPLIAASCGAGVAGVVATSGGSGGGSVPPAIAAFAVDDPKEPALATLRFNLSKRATRDAVRALPRRSPEDDPGRREPARARRRAAIDPVELRERAGSRGELHARSARLRAHLRRRGRAARGRERAPARHGQRRAGRARRRADAHGSAEHRGVCRKRRDPAADQRHLLRPGGHHGRMAPRERSTRGR